MNKKTLFLAGLCVMGAVILIFPDEGAPVIQLNKKHGPSWIDLIGLILMIAGWAGLSYRIITNWKLLTVTFGRTIVRLLLGIYFISVFGIVVALQVQIEWILWTTIAVAAIVNFSFVITTFQKKVSTYD